MARLMVLLPIATASGASLAQQAPAVLITGSYFPDWMVFLLVGIVTAIVVRVVLIRVGLDDFMPLRVIAYSALALAVTFALMLAGVPLP